ncbi:tripartite tricarboxylate transporter permease [Cereibacter sphaeroides]|nr:tripartite tricarboxylate transporter permease [Cereibacter sphaeroides]
MDSLLAGIALATQGTTLLYLMLGVLLGLWFGAIPGLGGVTAMILVLPFTFGMEPQAAFALLLGALAVSTTSDTISSVMLGIPGTIASQATVLDGHPMAKQGRVLTAFGAAFTVSAIGGVIGGIALAISLPIMTWLVLTFGAPEFFVLSLIGLVMVGGVSGNAIGKGIAAGALGLLLSQIGYPVAASDPRYWFDQMFLIDGLPLVPVVIGLFGIPEMMQLGTSGGALASQRFEKAEDDSLMAGVRAALANRWLAMRCSVLGTYVGMLPGLGASVVDWLAYGHGVQSAKDRSQFGKGDVRGVIAPEAANNATLGGSLIPTLAFGIPGSGAMAILLGAMTIHGLVPGPAMLQQHLPLTLSMVVCIILANIVGAGALMLWSKQVARAAFIDGNLVVPAVFVFLVMGSWIGQPEILTLVALLVIGLLGFALHAAGWPRPPLILGFVLGPVMENSLAITAQAYTLTEVLSRPSILILIALLLLIFIGAARAIAKRRNDFKIEIGASASRGSLMLSLALGIGCVALFVWAFDQAQDWSFLSRVFPMAICSVGAVVALGCAVQDFRALRRYQPTGAEDTLAGFWRHHRREVLIFVIFAVTIALVPVLGLAGAMLAFTALYLLGWGRFGWLTAVLYTAGVGAFLYVVYHRMLHVPFVPPFFLS